MVKFASLEMLRLSPKELPFDSTLGYPGEGPSAARPDVDLRVHRGLTPVVAARRAVRLRELLAHVELWYGLSLAALLALPANDVDRILSDFGQLMFRGGRSLLDFSETINAIVDSDRGLKGRLPRAWDVAWVWRTLLRAGNRVPMPDKVMLAMMTVALRWNPPNVALLIASGFLGLLRVHELRWLRFGSFLTPAQFLSDDPVLFIVIEKPKMRRLGARRAYTRIDDAAIVQFAECYATQFPPQDFVFDGSYYELRAVFNAICAEIGLPHGGPEGLTLGSLRPGGATWLYRVTDNTELVRFRGPWASLRMLEVYIQEVGALSILPGLPGSVRARVRQLADYAPHELAGFIDALTSPRL